MNADQICALLAIRELSVQLLCELPNDNPLHDTARTLARKVGTIAREAMPQEHIEGVDEAKRRCEKRYELGKFKLGRPLPAKYRAK